MIYNWSTLIAGPLNGGPSGDPDFCAAAGVAIADDSFEFVPGLGADPAIVGEVGSALCAAAVAVTDGAVASEGLAAILRQ